MRGEESPEELNVSNEIDSNGRIMLFNAMESGGMNMISLMTTFSPERVKEFVSTSPDGCRTIIDGDEFFPTLTKEEIKDWWTNSETAIIDYVKEIINVAERKDIAEIETHYLTKKEDTNIQQNMPNTPLAS